MTIDELTPPGGTARFEAVDLERIERAVREIIEAVGEDPRARGCSTRRRGSRGCTRSCSRGCGSDPRELLRVGFEVGHDEMVILKDIPFYSICEHHFMPFHGVAAVGYIPDGRVVGLSKLARLVDGYARRPQLQEQTDGADRGRADGRAGAGRRGGRHRGGAPVHDGARGEEAGQPDGDVGDARHVPEERGDSGGVLVAGSS